MIISSPPLALKYTFYIPWTDSCSIRDSDRCVQVAHFLQDEVSEMLYMKDCSIVSIASVNHSMLRSNILYNWLVPGNPSLTLCCLFSHYEFIHSFIHSSLNVSLCDICSFYHSSHKLDNFKNYVQSKKFCACLKDHILLGMHHYISR